MKTKTILTIAIFVRILLMPFFYHPDMKSQNFHFQFLSHGITNIYQYLNDHKTYLPYQDTFNYLPLTYFAFGTSQIIFKPLMPIDFVKWINDWGPYQNNYANLPYFLFILKIPYLICDVSIALILYKISSSRKLLFLWLFNPFTFYLIYVLGNFDILPVFLTVLAYFLLNKKTTLSFLLFGIAIALKLYPLLLLPFFLFSASKNIKKMILNTAIAFIPLVITIAPFVNNYAFWQSFFGSGLTQKVIENRLFGIPLFPIIYLSLIISDYFGKNSNLPKQIFYLFLLFVSVVNFHPQWLLWFLPFIYLLPNFTTRTTIIKISIITVAILFYIILFNDNYLTWGHLIPIDFQFINQTSPYDFLRNKYQTDPKTYQTYLKSFLTIFSIIIVLFHEKTLHNHHN